MAKVEMGRLGVFREALEEVVRVLEHGAAKYPDDLNWRQVSVKDHTDAMMRHALAYCSGVRRDPDSGQHHLAHAACRALFIVWLESNKVLPCTSPGCKDPEHNRYCGAV